MGPPPRATVLVGDDEPLLRSLTERILASQGFRIVTAADGEQVVQVAEATPCLDLVLLDATMPPAGAEPALRTIRARCPRVAVILTSGDALPAPLLHELEACHGVFLRKPFAPDALLHAVERLLEQEGG